VLVELLYFWFLTFIFNFLTKKEVYMSPFVSIGNQYFSLLFFFFFFIKTLTLHMLVVDSRENNIILITINYVKIMKKSYKKSLAFNSFHIRVP